MTTALDINAIANTISQKAPELRADLTDAIGLYIDNLRDAGQSGWYTERVLRLSMLREALNPQYPTYEPDPRD